MHIYLDVVYQMFNFYLLLYFQGMTVGDIPVTIAAVPEYGLPPSAPSPSNVMLPCSNVQIDSIMKYELMESII